MKGVMALGALVLLGGCSVFKPAPQQVDPWTRWVCDSKAEVNWRYADAAHKAVEVRLNQSDQVYRLQAEPGATGELYGNGVLSFARNGDDGLVYWTVTNDLIGRGCKVR